MFPAMEELRRMKSADIREIDKDKLKDISEIIIDENLTADNRIKSYLAQVHNPFFIKSGEYVIGLKYAESGRDMNDCMAEYLSKMAEAQRQDWEEVR